MWDRQLLYMVLSFMYLISAKKQNHLINLQKLIDMKKIFFFSVIIIAALITIVVACNKDIEGRTDNATCTYNLQILI